MQNTKVKVAHTLENNNRVNSSNGINSTKNSASHLLMAIMEQGSNEFSKALFYIICCVNAVCLIAMLVLLSSFGVDIIKAYFPIESWIVCLLFFSVLLGWAAKHFLKIGLELWRMTKED